MKIEIAGLCGAMVSSSKRLFPVSSWPPHMHASFLCCRHARFGAVTDLLAFELGKDSQLPIEHAADGGGRVDALGQGDEIDIAFAKFAEDLEQVQCRASEPVELPDHQRVAGFKIGEERIQSRPMGFCTGHPMVPIDCDAASSIKGVKLQILGLVLVRDADIAKAAAGVSDHRFCVFVHRSLGYRPIRSEALSHVISP